MKRVITICLLVVSIFVGGMTVDAKTTKKKGKAKTSQSSSASKYWNGDMPTAKLVLTYRGGWGNDNYGFANKGYRLTDGEVGEAWIKDGVCKIEQWGGSGGGETTVIVYDSAKRNKLYNDIKRAIANARSGEELRMKGNTIIIDY